MGLFGPNINNLSAKRNVEGLTKALSHKNLKIRKKAIIALGKIGDTIAVEPLIQVLKDGESDIRFWAAWALGNIQDKRALICLIQAFKDKDKKVRWKAADALGEMGDKRAVIPLIRVLKDEYEDTIVKWAVVEALGKIGGKRSVPSLMKALRDSDLRKKTANALLKIGEPALKPLIQALEDRSWEIRIKAVEILEEMGDKRAVRPLILTLKREEDWLLRAKAAIAIWKIMDNISMVKPLIRDLKEAKGMISGSTQNLGEKIIRITLEVFEGR